MMPLLICCRCGQELAALGALAFSPPDSEHRCDKFHICAACWPALRTFLWDGQAPAVTVTVTALATLVDDRGVPILDLTELRCSHGRPAGIMCPHCTGNAATASGVGTFDYQDSPSADDGPDCTATEHAPHCRHYSRKDT